MAELTSNAAQVVDVEKRMFFLAETILLERGRRITIQGRKPIFYENIVDSYESKDHLLPEISTDEQTRLSF